MANLITTRHKRPEHGERATPFTKRQSSRRIRRLALIEDIQELVPLPRRPTKHAKRKRSGNCPICLATLRKNSKGTRYIQRCDHCSSQLHPEIRCGRCGTFRVWRGSSECRCKGCGNVVELPQPNKTDGGHNCTQERSKGSARLFI